MTSYTHKTRRTTPFLFLCLVGLLACNQGTVEPDPVPQPIEIIYKSLTADGSLEQQSTRLTFTLAPRIEGLTLVDIKCSLGKTGAKIGALTEVEPGTYTLELVDLDSTGMINLNIAREGYIISPHGRGISVSKPFIQFTYLTANGSKLEATTKLTLEFDRTLHTLRASDIVLNAGQTGAVMGALQVAESGRRCTLAVSGIQAEGEIEVTVSLKAYNIGPKSRKVTVYPYPADGPAPFLSPELVAAIESNKSLNIITFFKNSDGKVSVKSNEERIAKVTSLAINNQNLTSLEGIEYFTNLGFLSCGDNNFAELIFPALPKLNTLWCDGNKRELARFDVTQLTALKVLHCSGNGIAALDLSQFSNLTHLSCGNNKLRVLDLSKCPNLKDIECSDNQLSVLDIRMLTFFEASDQFLLGEQHNASGSRQNLALSVTQAQNDLITANPEWFRLRGNYTMQATVN